MDVQSDLPDNIPDFNRQPEPSETPAAAGDTYNLSGDFRNATINIKSILQADAHWAANREYMLKRVRKDWLEGVLEPAAAIHGLIALELQHRDQLVENPWLNVVQRKPNPRAASVTSTQILNIFDTANGNLLILGEPGAGKTITLMQLASELIKRAETDPKQCIPVILNLSSWYEEHASLERWLIKELRGKYFVPQPIAEAWIAKDALALLLDGLDEVPESRRADCINAINSYRQDHGIVPIVVCSRRADYENQAQRLQLDDAVVLQPLGKQQIEQMLARHDQGKDLAASLDQDATLRQLARTPLMLNIMLLASQEVAAHDWSHIGDSAAHRDRLFDVYLKSVFHRRSLSAEHSEVLTLRVLPWLARNMAQQGQTIFLLENLSPSWLSTKSQRLGFTLGLRVLIALVLGLVIYLIYRSASAPDPYSLRMFLAVSIAALVTSSFGNRLNNISQLLLNMFLTALTCRWALGSLESGLVAGFVLGISGGAMAIAMRNPQMTDKLQWSWKRTASVLFGLVFLEILIGMLLYRFGGASTLSGIAEVLLLAALPVGAGITFAFGWRPSLHVAATVKPNQGFWQSLRNAVGISLFLILVLLPLSLPSGISHNLSQERNLWDMNGILSSLRFMVAATGLVVLPLSLLFGGAACVQHLIVRSILVSTEKLPWNLVGTLNNATDRIILQRVGGGYIFQHRLLQDYFADRNTD